MQLLFVTGNRHKFNEVKVVLKGFGVKLERKEIGSAEEKGDGLNEIALQKAERAFETFKRPLIVEDTGIFFKACNNFPGTEPRRVFEAIGYEGLFRALEGKSREAFFQTVICYIDSANSSRFFEGRLEGSIARRVIRPKAKVMPYEKIFIPKGENRALAEISRREKNGFSHRGIASRALGKWLESQT